MAIRIRKIDGKFTALCAAEHKSKKGDLYLNDGIHEALSIKFGVDRFSEGYEQGMEHAPQPLSLIHI